MKIFLRVIAVIVGLIALLLITALFTKKDYSVEREITVNKPKQVVFDYLKYLKNQEHYNTWTMKDPNAKKKYEGTDGTVGFVSSWESDNKEVGTGSEEITSIAEGERIDLALHFIKPFEGDATANFTTEAIGENQTKVKWGFASKMKYPLNLMLLFMNMDKMLGDELDKGLTNIKTNLEKQ